MGPLFFSRLYTQSSLCVWAMCCCNQYQVVLDSNGQFHKANYARALSMTNALSKIVSPHFDNAHVSNSDHDPAKRYGSFKVLYV